MGRAVASFADHRAHARRLVEAALEAADPAKALARHWDNSLDERPCVLLAVGKASVPMAAEAFRRLGAHVRESLITCPPDQVDAASFGKWPVKVMACDHPFPTARNVEAAHAAADLVRQTGPTETLIALISGGGSAHLTLPADGLTVDDLAAITRSLQRAGATITDLNCVRKHCEQLKGGRLAAMSGAGRLAAFILSDVIGDKLDVISSGPTVPDPTTYSQALAVLDRFELLGVAPAVTRHLRRGVANELDETPKPAHPDFSRVTNTIIASNRLVVEAVAGAARQMGFEVAGIEQAVEGEAADVGASLAARTRQLSGSQCYILGGETTVTVGDSKGIGGPSQELALGAAVRLDGLPGSTPVRAAILTFSTDGRDGPTDAAGALVTTETCVKARSLGLDPVQSLKSHDSYTLLDRLDALIRVPPTGTNLNHIAALLVYGS